MKTKVTISVIVPVYNVENYIEKCLNSIVEQTIFNQLEVIIINDGTEDNSLAICQEIARKFDNIYIYSKKMVDYRQHAIMD